MKHLVLSIILVLITATLFTSCQKEPVLTLIGLTNIELAADGGNQTLSFQTNKNWTVSWSEPWLNVSPSSGTASKGTITINVSANANQGVSRSATITIRAEGLTQTIDVNQLSGDLLEGTWGMTHYEYRHWSKGQLIINEDTDCNPYAPNIEWDAKFVFSHIIENQYKLVIYHWNTSSAQWYIDDNRLITWQNDKLLYTDPETNRNMDVDIISLSNDKLVLYGFERDIPSKGDEYYEKATFIRMN